MTKLQISRRWLLVGLFLVITLFTITAVQPTLAQDRAANGTIATGALNIRSGPGLDYSIVTTVYQGNVVAVLGRSGFNTWVQVRTYNGTVGWANSTYMTMDVPLNNLPVVGSGTTPTPGQTPAVGVVNTGAVNVRTGPGYGYPIITIAYQGYTFSLLGRTGDSAWAKVRMVDGTEGWVNFGALNTNVLASTLPVMEAPVSPPAGTAVGTVNTGALNVRSGPGLNYGSIAVAYNGHVVQLLGRNTSSTWAKVRLFDGQEGWVNAKYITTNTPISSLPILWDEAVIPGAPTGIVNTGNLNVRSGPGPSYNVLTVISYGDVVTLIGRNANGTWVKVRLSSGSEGWTNASYLNTSVAVSSLPIVDGSTGPGGLVGVVNTGALNVRSGPGVQFGSIEVIYQGTQVSLLGRNADGSWVRIQTPSGKTGWVNSTLLQTNVAIGNLPVVDTSGGTPVQPIVTNAVVTTGALNVRSGPSLDYPAVTVIRQDTELALIGRSATTGWVQVRLLDGQVGWVNPNFLYTTININTLPVTG